MVAERDNVGVNVNLTGTHRGEFQGIPANDRQVCFAAIDIITIIEDKNKEEWATADMMGLMQQI